MRRLNYLFKGLCLLSAGLSSLSTTSAQEKTAANKRPNIIFILSDDHAYQSIGAYGNKLARTPNIDRLAKEGALFNNALVTNSICGPSRATLLTGKYSHKNGYKLNEQKFNVDQQLFPSLLQNSGYQTAWIGKWHLGNLPKGFDYWNVLPGQGNYYNPDFISSTQDTVRIEGYVSNVITDLATKWIGDRDKDKPFFLVVGEKATHRSWEPDIQDLGAYDNITFPLPATFYDNYNTRLAAADQDMTIDKTMRLREDLKIHAGVLPTEAEIAKRKEELLAQLGSKKPTPQQERMLNGYLRGGLYSRLNEEQKKAVYDYYEGKVSKEFDEKKLSGKALTEWKFQRYMKDYFSVANSLDRSIGKILDFVEQNGLSDNTVIIYASDNGFYMGEHGWFDKRFIYEESLKIPMVVKYPGVVKPGSKINSLVLNNDWAPTVLDIAGVKAPGDVQGSSILPLLKTATSSQAKPNWRKDAYYHYYEFPQPHNVYPHFGIKTEQYTLVHFYGEINSWELFDLKKDPSQLKNLYGTKEYSARTKDLKQRLKDLIIKYDDKEALSLFNK
ncbi:sulfatase family protein [Desertivirga arenae]|uniref:sulfatase family protein n=1 Tax=Desertivirga arenae TaxID=2810309 RepID=UPI001A9638A0|nr:sulfatase [Pedobacter sp. SYSU D00823]